ncbi:MAG TPA: hypothetical protein VIV55_09880 [Flavobacterium sp.]
MDWDRLNKEVRMAIESRADEMLIRHLTEDHQDDILHRIGDWAIYTCSDYFFPLNCEKGKVQKFRDEQEAIDFCLDRLN